MAIADYSYRQTMGSDNCGCAIRVTTDDGEIVKLEVVRHCSQHDFAGGCTYCTPV